MSDLGCFGKLMMLATRRILVWVQEIRVPKVIQVCAFVLRAFRVVSLFISSFIIRLFIGVN